MSAPSLLPTLPASIQRRLSSRRICPLFAFALFLSVCGFIIPTWLSLSLNANTVVPIIDDAPPRATSSPRVVVSSNGALAIDHLPPQAKAVVVSADVNNASNLHHHDSQPPSIQKKPKQRYEAFPQTFSESYLQSTEPRQNVATLGYWRRHFYSGFRNQIMAFSTLCMHAGYSNYSQIVVSTLLHKDTYGSDRMMPHEYLFDVEHWNSWVPVVPRLVRCVNFTDLDCGTGKWKNTTSQENATDPYAKGEPFKLFAMYLRYSKQKGKFAIPTFRNPIDVAILKGALRPHPDIRSLMKSVLHAATGGLPYFTLHARVEPDMQKHPVCKDFKVTNLTDIFSSLERAFPVPPATKLFLPINRPSLEEGSKIKTGKKKEKTNWLGVHNLQTLNHVVKYGLWNGTVKVFELGSTVLNGTKFEKTPSTIGAMMNFYFALDSTVFVGTEVSSWSNDVTASRFYRGNLENYKFLPSGIEKWTNEEMTNAPSFMC